MRFNRTRDDVVLPEKMHIGDVGYDCYLPESVDIEAFSVKSIDLGISINLKKDEFAFIAARSSIAQKNIIINTSPIDSGYKGSIHAIVHNLNNKSIHFDILNRICQVIIAKMPHDKCKINKKRNKNGFGSSGK